MHQITNDKPETRQKITLCRPADFEVSYFCGSGAGGQARNKVASGVQIKHTDSGAIGRASDSRSQADNKRSALERLTKTAQFKFWLEKKLYEIDRHETLEQTVEREVESGVKYEIKNATGQWEEVSAAYFETETAKQT